MRPDNGADAAQDDLFVGCLFARDVYLIAFALRRAHCVLVTKPGAPPKMLGFDRALPPRKFCEKFLDPHQIL